MAYKMIAIDLDDTLLTHSGQILPRVRTAIGQATELGVRVLICTGRTLKGVQRFYDELGLDTLLITAGGAEVYDHDRNLVFSCPLDSETTRQILSFAYERGLHPQIYLHGELVFRERNHYARVYEGPYGYPGIVEPDLLTMPDIATPKLLIVMDADKVAGVQREAKAQFPQLTIKQSKPMYLEFMHPSVSKGDALKFAASAYGIPLREVIAVGDTEIDIPMMELAGLGVAVANAHEPVKRMADVVCPASDEGGVADVIQKYILEESQ